MSIKNSGIGAKKSDARPSKNKKNTLARQAVSTKNWGEHHKLMATAAYAKKRGFKGSDADAMQDWLEVEVEIDDAQDVNGIDYKFLTRRSQQMN
jgi:hypothetical protein